MVLSNVTFCPSKQIPVFYNLEISLKFSISKCPCSELFEVSVHSSQRKKLAKRRKCLLPLLQGLHPTEIQSWAVLVQCFVSWQCLDKLKPNYGPALITLNGPCDNNLRILGNPHRIFPKDTLQTLLLGFLIFPKKLELLPLLPLLPVKWDPHPCQAQQENEFRLSTASVSPGAARGTVTLFLGYFLLLLPKWIFPLVKDVTSPPVSPLPGVTLDAWR